MTIADQSGLTPTVLRLYLGQPYRYSHSGLYAPLCFAQHGRSGTDFVCYVGLDGADQGKHYVCEESEWELKFTRVVAEEPRLSSPRPAERVAGRPSTGSGV